MLAFVVTPKYLREALAGMDGIASCVVRLYKGEHGVNSITVEDTQGGQRAIIMAGYRPEHRLEPKSIRFVDENYAPVKEPEVEHGNAETGR